MFLRKSKFIDTQQKYDSYKGHSNQRKIKMWTPQYDIIVETLTGSQFEVTVTEKDTVGYIKSRIQKYEGIPVDQQHLIYNHKELLDKTEIKDIPLVKGSTVKLVLDMKGGPVSARRVVTLPGYDKWFDLSDVLNHSGQDSLPVKLLVYKDCKKNIHRVMKLRADRKNMLNRNTEVQPEFPHDNDTHDDQWLKDNIQTLEKMRQIKSKLDKKKKTSKNAIKNDCVSDLIQDEDDEDDLLKDNYKLNLSFIPNDDFVGGGCKLDKFNKQAIDNEIEDVFLDGLMIEDKKNKSQNKPFSLSPRRPVKQQEKSNFSRFFHHRNSSPTLNSSSSPTTSAPSTLPTFDYIQSCNLDKNKGFSQSCNYIPTDNRTKLRDNIRRNRSFKLIDNDLIIEENESTNRALSASINAIGCDKNSNNKKCKTKIRSNSASVHDILEHININKSAKDNEQQPSSSSAATAMSSMKLNKRWNTPKLRSSGYENKLFIDKEQSFPLNSQEQCSANDDYKLDGGKIENYRVYKMSSDAKNCYELPKLLIREDSPVESFHSSDSQLETIALRGNSPKNVIDPFSKLDDNDTKLPENHEEEAKNQSANSLLKLYDSATNQNQRETLLNMYETPDGGGGGASSVVNNVGSITMDNLNKTSTWNYHHSDLGLNKLELSFLNEDLSNPASDMSCMRKSNSVLKIASSNLEINKWKNISQFNGKPPEATASLNFINGDVTSSDDDDNDDVFNSCELLNNKSKSVELNEFRMMFGSSPTLLNTNNYNFNPITQSSRLDAVPFQYRRGYSNLNDACLSSSTSDLECFQNNNKKKTYKNKNANNELPSLYRHRNNEHLDYIRSYENLDRTRIVRVRNERVPSSNNHHHISNSHHHGSNSNTNKNKFTTLSRERCLQEEDDDDGSCDNFLSYSNLCFENGRNSVGCIGAGSNIKRNLNKSSCSNSNSNNISSSSSSNHHRPIKDEIGGINPIGYPSDENIFNINFDNFEDDVLEIDTMKLFENSIDLETTVSLLNSCSSNNNNNLNNNDSNNGCSNKLDNNHLLLPDIDNKYKNMAVDRLIKIDINNKNEINNNNNINNTNSTSSNNNNNKKSTKLRCAKCNKKLGVIMIMKCHCENIFCAQHRYAEAHNCTYNFKMEGKKIIAKENPQVIAQKLPKI